MMFNIIAASIIKNLIYRSIIILLPAFAGYAYARFVDGRKIFDPEDFKRVLNKPVTKYDKVWKLWLLILFVLIFANVALYTYDDVCKVLNIREEISNGTMEDNFYREEDEISEMVTVDWYHNTITIYSTDYSLPQINNEEIHSYQLSKDDNGIMYLIDESDVRWNINFYTRDSITDIVLSHDGEMFCYENLEDIYS